MSLESQWPASAIDSLSMTEAQEVLGRSDSSAETIDMEEMLASVRINIETLRGKLEQVLLARGKRRLLTGDRYTKLHEGMRVYLTPSGIRMTVATDKGVNRQPGRPQKPNEDRIVVDTAIDFASIVDGAGGYGDGDKAADTLARAIGHTRGDIPKAVRLARRKNWFNPKKKKNINNLACSCFMSAQVIWDPDGHPFLSARQAGDVHLLVLNPDDTVAFESVDEDLVTHLVADGDVAPDKAPYHFHRNIVEHSIGRDRTLLSVTCDPLPLTSGQRVILMSDGITDNVGTEELRKLIAGKTVKQSIHIISNVTQKRMEDMDEIIRNTGDRTKVRQYSDGFESAPKRDNRAIVIIEIP